MIFENVTEIGIEEGIVSSIACGTDLLWARKQAYTDLIPTATSTPGGTEIYNGTGYQDGYRWSSSAKTETAYTTGRISGWIPFVSGATYRIRNFYMSTTSGYVDGGYLVLYADDGTISAKIIGRTNENYDSATDTFVWCEENSTCKYFRISAYKGDDAPIITMNEEITP